MKDRFLSVLGQLRRVILRHGDGGLNDGQLLDRFIHQRDETAFEVLVWRHGPMVLGVGRRVLHNLDDAEDILQATFLSLVRQARSIRRREAIAGWLYQVAYRLALRARQQKKKRSQGQVVLSEVAAAASSSDDPGQEELRLLDEELQRLPEKYRIPLVLSYLQGMTNQEIAVRITCPIGTVFTRLARGREMLRKRLIRRGVTLSAGLMGAAVTPERTIAALRAELVRGMVRAGRLFVECPESAAGVLSPNVIALAEGVEKMMVISRWKLVGVVVTLFAVMGSGAGLLAWRTTLPEQESTPTAAQKPRRSASAVNAQSKAAEPDALPTDRDRPKIVQVFPADGATDVEPINEIRIRFDRPMDPTSAVLEWDFRNKSVFHPRGEMRYDEKTHEFILPVQLLPGRTHSVTVNRQSRFPGKDKEFEGFRSSDHIAAKPYGWSLTTNKPPIQKENRPRVTSLTPVSDSEVSLLTLLEVAFDKPMDPNRYAISSDDSVGWDRAPELLGHVEYDAQRHRFTLLFALPANWNGEVRLEGFRDKNGVEAEPIVVKYRTQRSIYSDALRKRIEQAGQSEKLHQLVERVRKARRELQSVSEEARTAHSSGPRSYWYQTFEMKGARFQMQGEQKYLGVVDDIMRIPFRIGSDGTTAWLRIRKERITLPAKEIKEKNVRICDAFDSAGTEDAKRVIQDMKLEHLGEVTIRGRRCQRVRSWVTELYPFGSLSGLREWYIDAQTLLPLRVEMAGIGLQVIDYTHHSVNQPIPDKEFSHDQEAGVKDGKAEPLDKDYTYRFLNVIDGSNGRMSVRWGEKGPKGTRSSGLN